MVENWQGASRDEVNKADYTTNIGHIGQELIIGKLQSEKMLEHTLSICWDREIIRMNRIQLYLQSTSVN